MKGCWGWNTSCSDLPELFDFETLKVIQCFCCGIGSYKRYVKIPKKVTSLTPLIFFAVGGFKTCFFLKCCLPMQMWKLIQKLPGAFFRSRGRTTNLVKSNPNLLYGIFTDPYYHEWKPAKASNASSNKAPEKMLDLPTWMVYFRGKCR